MDKASKQHQYQSTLSLGAPYQSQSTQFYVWGSNEYGQVGFKIKNDDRNDQEGMIMTPKLLTYNIVVKQVACGLQHTHILSQSGFVYSMGSNKDGRLGLGLTEQQLKSSTSPRLIETLQLIKTVECGDAHTIAIDRSYSVYGWGNAENGALGIRQTQLIEPTIIDVRGKPIKDVSCGAMHSAFLTLDGQVFMCGVGRNGQLGLGQRQLIEFEPEQVRVGTNEEDKIKQVICGANHTLFLMESGLLYSCGDNSLGQLGLEHTQNMYLPSQVKGLKQTQIRRVCAGSRSTYALTYTGQVFVFGLYDSQKNTSPSLIKLPKQIVDLKCRSDLASAIDTDNKIWLWSNQHKMKGVSSVPQIYTGLPNQKVTKVFLGQNLVFAVAMDHNTELSIAKKSLKKLIDSRSNQKKKKNKLAKQRNGVFEQRSSSVCTQNSNRKKQDKIAIISYLNSNLSVSPISKKSNYKTPVRCPSGRRSQMNNSQTKEQLKSSQGHYYNYKTQLNVKDLEISGKVSIQFEDDEFPEDDIQQFPTNHNNSLLTPQPPLNQSYISTNNDSVLQKENQQLKAQLEAERLKVTELQDELCQVKKEQQEYQQDMDSKLNDLGQQMHELFTNYQEQSKELDTYRESYQQIQEQNQRLKEQLVKMEDILAQRDDELQVYAQIGAKLVETEQYIDSIIADKDAREEELLNKMSTLADHYHREKEKNGKLMAEMQRLNETLSRFDSHMRLLQNEKSKADEAVDILQDELARNKVECDKGKYNILVNKVQPCDSQSQFTQSTERSQITVCQLEEPIKNQRKENKENSLSKLLKNYHYYDQNNASQISTQDQSNTNKSLNYSYDQNLSTLNKSYEEIVNTRVTQLSKEEQERKRENYNTYVLKSLELKAQKASAEKKGNNSVLYQSIEKKYRSQLPQIQESPLTSHKSSGQFDLEKTNQSIQLKEVPREAFRELSNTCNIETIQQSEVLTTDGSECKPRSRSQNKRVLADLVANEMKEVSEMMSSLQKYGQRTDQRPPEVMRQLEYK